jgi:hypothetical protein
MMVRTIVGENNQLQNNLVKRCSSSIPSSSSFSYVG